MGYLIKSDVISALEEDMGNAMMCYEGKERKDIVRLPSRPAKATAPESRVHGAGQAVLPGWRVQVLQSGGGYGGISKR